MNFDNDDIVFSRLTDKQFEELCFDLLVRLGYKGLLWRRGGADSGRDIEGRLTVNNSLIGAYDEKWFFECKCQKKGISPEIINSKIAWADAEKPHHFVIFTSSYLSNNTRTWLDKIGRDKPYFIHSIEGKELTSILLQFPDLVGNYFIDQYTKVLLDSRKNWLIHDLLPDLDTLSLIMKNINFDKLSVEELAFLWCAGKVRTSEIDEWPDNSEPFYMDVLFQDIAHFANTAEPLIEQDKEILIESSAFGSIPWEVTYPKCSVARLVLNATSKPRKALYTFVIDNEGEGIEVITEASGDFPTRVRHIKQNAKEERKKAFEILYTVDDELRKTQQKHPADGE
jgi:Restriction endonuclease